LGPKPGHVSNSPRDPKVTSGERAFREPRPISSAVWGQETLPSETPPAITTPPCQVFVPVRDYLIVNPDSPWTEQFERLMDTHAPALRRFCCARRSDPSDRQDLFQEIAKALWTALPNFRRDASERTWLYRIAQNVAFSDATVSNLQAAPKTNGGVNCSMPCGAWSRSSANSRRSIWKVLHRGRLAMSLASRRRMRPFV
jgi:hypothetical protein